MKRSICFLCLLLLCAFFALWPQASLFAAEHAVRSHKVVEGESIRQLLLKNKEKRKSRRKMSKGAVRVIGAKRPRNVTMELRAAKENLEVAQQKQADLLQQKNITQQEVNAAAKRITSATKEADAAKKRYAISVFSFVLCRFDQCFVSFQKMASGLAPSVYFCHFCLNHRYETAKAKAERQAAKEAAKKKNAPKSIVSSIASGVVSLLTSKEDPQVRVLRMASERKANELAKFEKVLSDGEKAI